MTNATLSSGSTYTVAIKNPDGTAAFSNVCFIGLYGCTMALSSLTQTGTYTATVTPGGQATISVTATLSPVVLATLASNTPYTLTLGAVGQSAALSFIAAGQDAAISVSGITSSPANITYSINVYSPTGRQVGLGGGTSSVSIP